MQMIFSVIKNLKAVGCYPVFGKYFGTELRWFEEFPPGRVLADAVSGDETIRVILMPGNKLTPEVRRTVKINVEEWKEVESWNQVTKRKENEYRKKNSSAS